jgi:hypothetical protein
VLRFIHNNLEHVVRYRFGATRILNERPRSCYNDAPGSTLSLRPDSDLWGPIVLRAPSRWDTLGPLASREHGSPFGNLLANPLFLNLETAAVIIFSTVTLVPGISVFGNASHQAESSVVVKLILSRKGFDSSAGGFPSPIFPDGTMISLPIPDEGSRIRYSDIAGNRHASVGELVKDLANRPPAGRAHLDPDLSAHVLPRERGWRPLFGQVDAAQSHLENNGVGVDDVFLFFGWFRRVERTASRWQYVPSSPKIHAIFGWLQVAERVPACKGPGDKEWARYYQHFHMKTHPVNMVYVANKRLLLPDLKFPLPGAGLFPAFTPRLQLTEPSCSKTSLWLLPECFRPKPGSGLTYHRNHSRWQRVKDGVMLTSVGRGQEFVLDCDHYPGAITWLEELLKLAAHSQ